MNTHALEGRSLLTLLDFTPGEIGDLLDLAVQVKQERGRGERNSRFSGYSLAMLFEKRSTRTRCAFETAFGEEGGAAVFLSTQDIHLGEKESIEDTARVLGRMFDAIQFRGFEQRSAEILSEYSGVPVYNGLTDKFHPTQGLADLMTIKERCGRLAGIRMCFVGDGRNNVANSLIVAASKAGINLTIATPDELRPDEDLVRELSGDSAVSGGRVVFVSDATIGVEHADVIYSDVWTSMGEEKSRKQRETLLTPFQVNQALMNASGNPETIFLHCLPAVKGQEVTADVLDGPQSAAWDQAENRKHTIKALMLATLGI